MGHKAMSSKAVVTPDPLGTRLRDRRQALGLTLKEVGDQAGLSVGFISQIERGITIPSLTSLINVCRVLKSEVGDFLNQPPGDKPVTRHDERPVYALGDNALTYERLSAAFPGNVLRSIIFHEPPGFRSEPMAHEGEEIFFILEGALDHRDRRRAHHPREPGTPCISRRRRTHVTWNHTTSDHGRAAHLHDGCVRRWNAGGQGRNQHGRIACQRPQECTEATENTKGEVVMKSLLKPLAAALIAATSLTGVAVIAASPAAAETVLRLDEVAVGELDPAKATDYADSMLMFNVYDTLVLSKQGGAGVVPHLAESWETDGKTYTFKLRTDVKFQSGNPLTADDVVFSLDRMKGIGQGLSYLFANVEKAEAVDAGTVKFTLSSPYSPFISALLRLPIVDKKLVMENLADGEGEMKDWGQAYLSTHGGGSGAYKVVSHNPQEETVMAKNADYFLGVPAKAPDTVRLRYGLEAATVRTLVAQGEHDITSQWLPPEVLKALAADGAQLLTESGALGLLCQDEHDQEAARRRQLPHGADQRIRLCGGHPDGGDHRQGLARQPGDRRVAGRHARLAAGGRRLQARPRRGEEISRRTASTSRRISTSSSPGSARCRSKSASRC